MNGICDRCGEDKMLNDETDLCYGCTKYLREEELEDEEDYQWA